VKTVDALLDSLDTDHGVLEVLVGSFWTAVVIDSDPPRCGLASTLRPPFHPHGPPVGWAGTLLERSGLELAGLLRSSSTLEASIGMAALNGLLEVDESACIELNAAEVILERGAGRRVAIVGHFPFVERVSRAAADCCVLELRPRQGDLSADRAAEVLPRADVVAITGTSLTNHTFDSLVELCRSDAYVIALGASAPLSPVLLDAGLDAVSGTLVTDPPRVLRSVGQGATYRQMKRAGGIRLLTLQN
jgi:uncharacterized protein (DUF4213/DUF364 family)